MSVILWIESGWIHDQVYDQEGQEMDQDPTGPGSKAGSGDTAWILFKWTSKFNDKVLENIYK